MSREVIRTEALAKTFRLGFRRKKVEALRNISFSVDQGEIFGFLGPNGAGKTTTIKLLVGLLRPSSGSCFLLGRPAGEIEARRHVGYLPESPYFYDHLLPDEFMDLCGRLRGLDRVQRRRRGEELLDIVGLGAARDRPLRKFSKGMLQRIGLAQSLVGDPELLILDEPMTGLDPVGRMEVRNLILDLRRRGKTIFFSSHILSDVETLCDRVAIVDNGNVIDRGTLKELLEPAGVLVDVELVGVSEELEQRLEGRTHALERGEGGRLEVTLKGEDGVDEVLRIALELGASVRSVVPRRESLEALFVRQALKSSR